MIVLGKKVTFNPIELGCIPVKGKIVAIHWSHRWFSVEYGDDNKFRTSFSFNDIGDKVILNRTRRANKKFKGEKNK